MGGKVALESALSHHALAAQSSPTGKNGDETTRIGARMSSFGRVSSRRVDALCNFYRATAKSAGTRSGNEDRQLRLPPLQNSTKS